MRRNHLFVICALASVLLVALYSVIYHLNERHPGMQMGDMTSNLEMSEVSHVTVSHQNDSGAHEYETYMVSDKSSVREIYEVVSVLERYDGLPTEYQARLQVIFYDHDEIVLICTHGDSAIEIEHIYYKFDEKQYVRILDIAHLNGAKVEVPRP